MFAYQKRLQFPINIKKKDLKMAKFLLSQYGGPYGELAASLQYLNQRFSMPDGRGKVRRKEEQKVEKVRLKSF